MNKKYIIGAVVVIIALGAGFMWGKKSAVAPEAPVVGGVAGESATTTASTTTAKKAGATTTVAPKTTTATPAAPAMTKDGAYIVSYTNGGFSPKTITIKVGKAVHFVNNSNKAMSVTTTTTQNQVQSELNQGKTVGQGGTYDFTFTAPGTWVYMNRNAQSDYGTVIVQ